MLYFIFIAILCIYIFCFPLQLIMYNSNSLVTNWSYTRWAVLAWSASHCPKDCEGFAPLQPLAIVQTRFHCSIKWACQVMYYKQLVIWIWICGEHLISILKGSLTDWLACNSRFLFSKRPLHCHISLSNTSYVDHFSQPFVKVQSTDQTKVLPYIPLRRY